MSSFGFASGAFNSQTVFYSTSIALPAGERHRPHLDIFDEALRLLDEARALIESQGHRVCEPELHRLRACAELSRGSSAQVVEYCFDRALEVARAQRARFWELRTAVSRFWRDQGKRTEAHDLLAPIYGW